MDAEPEEPWQDLQPTLALQVGTHQDHSNHMTILGDEKTRPDYQIRATNLIILSDKN